MKPVAVLLPLLLLCFQIQRSFAQDTTAKPSNLSKIPGLSKPLHLPKLVLISPPPAIPKIPLNLETIDLIRASQQLNEAFVTAFRPAIHQEIDRLTYDVQADPESKSNDALEMLRKVPMITVDGLDQIQLKGSENFLIFINGKPSALMTNNPADMLKSLPAAAIQKIEVITVPPAKYDAEGVIGIINIIIVIKTDEGYNVNLFTRYNTVFGERGSVSLNLKQGKFGLSLLLGAAHQPLRSTATGSELTNISPASTLSQQGDNTAGANIHNGQVQLNFNPDSLRLLNGFFDFFERHFTLTTLRNTQFSSPPDSPAKIALSDNLGTGTIGAIDAGLSYQIGSTHHKGELLTLSWQYSKTTNIHINSITASDSAYSNQHAIQLDYVRPMGQWTVETGAKTTFTINTGTQFTYHQNILAAYNSWQLKVAAWTFKTGLRLEHTDITPITRHLDDLIPSISIQYNYPDNSSLIIGYTHRIQRPVLQQLNPFIDRSNPDFISTGNPALRPVINHILEFDYNKPGKWPVNVNLSYAFANNALQAVTLLLNDTLSDFFSTWSNLGSSQTAGMNLSTSCPLTRKLTVTINTQLTDRWITGTYNAQFYRNNGLEGNVDLFARYNLDHGMTININFSWQSGRVLLQGSTTHWTWSTYNITKEVLNKKLTLSLTIYDPYATYSYGHSNTKTPDFNQTGFTQFYYRQFRFAINYKFGQLKTSDKQPTE